MLLIAGFIQNTRIFASYGNWKGNVMEWIYQAMMLIFI
jgi:hypothetical protein